MRDSLMYRRTWLLIAFVLIVAVSYLFPGCDKLVTEVTKETIIQYVRADFSADKEFGCAPCTVQFNENSGGEPDSFMWRFGDGGTSFVRLH
jgi:PKD repeat protein